MAKYEKARAHGSEETADERSARLLAKVAEDERDAYQSERDAAYREEQRELKRQRKAQQKGTKEHKDVCELVEIRDELVHWPPQVAHVREPRGKTNADFAHNIRRKVKQATGVEIPPGKPLDPNPPPYVAAPVVEHKRRARSVPAVPASAVIATEERTEALAKTLERRGVPGAARTIITRPKCATAISVNDADDTPVVDPLAEPDLFGFDDAPEPGEAMAVRESKIAERAEELEDAGVTADHAQRFAELEDEIAELEDEVGAVDEPPDADQDDDPVEGS